MVEEDKHHFQARRLTEFIRWVLAHTSENSEQSSSTGHENTDCTTQESPVHAAHDPPTELPRFLGPVRSPAAGELLPCLSSWGSWASHKADWATLIFGGAGLRASSPWG